MHTHTRTRGVHVCIAARTQDVLNQVLAELEQTGHKGHAVAVDLTTQASCKKVVQETIDHLGGVDILVNNVGVAKNADILALQPKLIDDALSLKRLLSQSQCSRFGSNSVFS